MKFGINIRKYTHECITVDAESVDKLLTDKKHNYTHEWINIKNQARA